MIQIWTVKTCPMLCAEQMNLKPSINHRWCPSNRFNRRYKSFFWLEGFWIKTSMKSIVKSKLAVHECWWEWIHCQIFCAKHGFLSDKVKITIRKARQCSKSTTLTIHIKWQVLALTFLHLYMILIIEHCYIEGKACGENTRLELSCHHSGWDIVVQVAAAQMGKWRDPLESGMSTSMYSSGFFLISSDK